MKNIKRLILLIVLPCLLIGIFVYAYPRFIDVEGGYKLIVSSQGIYQSDLESCSIAVNDGNRIFFIPTRSTKEISAFESHTPSDITIVYDSQPQCGTNLTTKCINGDISAFVNYDCGTDNYDKCYTWSCDTTCGSVFDCAFVDVGGGGGPGGCFVAGTMISMVDGTKKHVESVVTGDILFGAGGVHNVVEKLFKIDYRRKLYSLNGGKYFVSDTHPFMTTEGWKSFYPTGSLKENPDLMVSTLHVGDILITESGLIQLVSVDSHYDRQYVYNFKTDGNHTYYADGYLVHNPTQKASN